VQSQSYHRLSGDDDPTRGPFPTTTGLSFAGFFFPLLKPVLGVDGHPAVRQQGFQCGSVGGRNRWKAT
jgi:hypothetical protein